MKSAIVTGANGFVGSALVRELSDRQVETYAVVRNKQSDLTGLEGLKGVHVVFCDMDHLPQLPELLPERPEVFYHLAWTGSSGPARRDYALQLLNARWTGDAVGAAKALGCSRFVGAGTLAESDVQAYTPLDGSTPNAVSCYGVAKTAAHWMSKAECCRLGIEHLWARLSNIYGIGNYTSNFVNFAAKTMLTGQPANFTTGEQPYDFVHIRDVVQGLYRVGESGRANCSYFIGSTKPDKLKEFIKLIRDEIDPAIQLNLGAVPFRGIAQPESVFDCTKLVRDTGYTPQVTFREGIRQTVPWLREQIEEGRL